MRMITILRSLGTLPNNAAFIPLDDREVPILYQNGSFYFYYDDLGQNELVEVTVSELLSIIEDNTRYKIKY